MQNESIGAESSYLLLKKRLISAINNW